MRYRSGATFKTTCWRYNDYGEPPEDERFVSISTANEHACGLRADGVAICWGRNVESPPENQRFLSISSGEPYTCGLRQDRSIACWEYIDGEAKQASLGNISDQRFTSISVAGHSVCGLQADGSAICNRPQAPTDERFVSISSGEWHVCGLRGDGSVFCWGENERVQMSPPKDARFTAISSGPSYTCGLQDNGAAMCWGTHERSDPDSALVVKPPQSEIFTSISSGAWFTCGLQIDGTPVCWGYLNKLAAALQAPACWGDTPPRVDGTQRGQGDPTCWGLSSSFRSVGLPPEAEFISISSGSGSQVCGLRKDGSAICWGSSNWSTTYR